MDNFSKAIARYVQLSEKDWSKILSSFETKELKKGHFLVKSGQVSNEFMFIEKGCLRVFEKLGEKETSAWFAFEDEFFCQLGTFILQHPSGFCVQAIEDTTVQLITRPQMETLYIELPVFETFIRKFWEDVIAHLINNTLSLQTETAEKRYEKALQHPKLLQRVPLKYLSSYLGITPSSLSRLRKHK